VILVNKWKISPHSKFNRKWSKGDWEAMLENLKKGYQILLGYSAIQKAEGYYEYLNHVFIRIG